MAKVMREKRPVLYSEDNRRPIEGLSRKKILDSNITGSTFVVVGDPKHWSAFEKDYYLCVVGDRIFWMQINCISVTFKDGKLYGSMLPGLLLRVCKVLHIDWVNWMRNGSWIQRVIQTRKDLWTAVFSGRITNPEMLAKLFSKKYFKGAYSYNTLKKIGGYYAGLSLWDLYYYTTNPDMALNIFIDDMKDNAWISTFRDAIEMAKVLNEKINPKWSFKRLEAEHQRQIDTINMEEIEKCSNELIAPAFSAEGLSLILDERTCFAEGMHMHNCVHTCYWDRITEGRYLIARGIVNGEYVDVGIGVGSNTLCLDQVHGKYNSWVDADKKVFCMNWIAKHENDLINTIRHIKGEPIIELPQKKNLLTDMCYDDDIEALARLRRRLEME